MSQLIEHTGIITDITEQSVQVLIVQHTACEECHAKTACSASDKKEKIIEIENVTDNFQIGDQVMVYGNQTIAFQAIFWGYILPFSIVLIVLIVCNTFNINELISALSALASLFPYYLILAFFDKNLKNRFRFKIRIL